MVYAICQRQPLRAHPPEGHAAGRQDRNDLTRDCRSVQIGFKHGGMLKGGGREGCDRVDGLQGPHENTVDGRVVLVSIGRLRYQECTGWGRVRRDARQFRPLRGLDTTDFRSASSAETRDETRKTSRHRS